MEGCNIPKSLVCHNPGLCNLSQPVKCRHVLGSSRSLSRALIEAKKSFKPALVSIFRMLRVVFQMSPKKRLIYKYLINTIEVSETHSAPKYVYSVNFFSV